MNLSFHRRRLLDQGQSGIGNGNFQEIGALDVDLKPRNSTWLQKADLIFVVRLGDLSVSVFTILNLLRDADADLLRDENCEWRQDNPVGVGYSYVEDESALVKTDLEAAADLTELLKALVKELPTLQSSPLFLVGESYGGKLAAMTGVSVARAIRAGTLKITLGGW